MRRVDMELEQRENPAGALCELEHKNLDLNFCEKVEAYDYKHKDISGESKTEETTVQEQGEEKDDYRKPPDELDPRIQEELEHLNEASEEINQLELQLEEERSSYRKIFTHSARKLNAFSSQLGSCIEKARPYYEARRLAKEAQQETQKAALSYERAVSMHSAAREMVYVAEQGLGAHKTLDQTWQEMLNHATAKVNEAEEERVRSEREHMRVTKQCQTAEANVQELQKALKKTIIKSKPYFELKAHLNFMLEAHKLKVTQFEEHVTEAKRRYSFTLQSLEKISEEIHAQRGQDNSEDGSTKSFGARSPPVGAEAVIGTELEGGQCRVLNNSNDKVNGREAETQEWVERHRASEWWEGAKGRTASAVGVGSDANSVFSLKTIASDLEKCDSVEHLGQLSDSVSFSEEDDEKVKIRDEKGGKGQENEQNLEFAGNDSQEQLTKHHRSVSL